MKTFKKPKSAVVKFINALLAFLFLAISILGIFLPILPYTPFFILSLFFFARSSQKLDDWIKSTKLYTNYIGRITKHKVMIMWHQIALFIFVAIVLGVAIYFSNSWIVNSIIWAALILKGIFFLAYYTPCSKSNFYLMKQNSVNLKGK